MEFVTTEPFLDYFFQRWVFQKIPIGLKCTDRDEKSAISGICRNIVNASFETNTYLAWSHGVQLYNNI